MHDTLAKFQYPTSLVKEYTHWVVLARPQQTTAGAVVLVSKHNAQALSALPVEAYAEMGAVVKDIETALQKAVQYQKINYMALMMVDKEVHFHVLPRYEGSKTLAGITVADEGWPKLPVMASGPVLNEEQLIALRDELKKVW